jgi:hypothetical protein
MIQMMFAEWRKDPAGQLEALDAERNTDNRQAKNDSAQQVAQEDQKSTEDKEQDIANQRHRVSSRTDHGNPTPAGPVAVGC